MQIRQDEARYVQEAVDMDQDGLHIIDQSAIVEEIIEGPTIVESAIKRPKGRRIHRKLLRIVLGGIVTISVVLGLLNQSPGSGAVDTTGTDLHQTTPIPASTPLPTSRPTSKRASPTPKASTTQGVPTSLTPGPLLLLNPGIVRQGSSLSVTGSGFGAKATIDLVLKRQASGTSLASTFVQTDKSGTFDGVSLTLPTELRSGTFIVEAHQRNSDKVAHVVGTVVEDMPQVKLGTQVGTPGDVIAFSVHGFRPGEPINIYWNSMSGQPIATLHADGSGAVAQATVEVPFGTVGTNTFLFVGSKSQALAVASILLLSLYPTVTLSSYAIQADNLLSFTGSGFGPGERVLVYLNNPNDQPIATIQTNADGSFSKAGGFVIPFVLKGQQTLIFTGEQSRASSVVSFTILPYTPSVQPSTYGGFPGTTVTFYATGFARNEVVHVYVGRTQNSAGTMVSCFRTNDQGNAGAAGSYVISGNAQVGPLVFVLIGSKSGGTATAAMQVSAAPTPVQVPPQPPFTCPLDTTP